jgi:hypothetical protein
MIKATPYLPISALATIALQRPMTASNPSASKLGPPQFLSIFGVNSTQ